MFEQVFESHFNNGLLSEDSNIRTDRAFRHKKAVKYCMISTALQHIIIHVCTSVDIDDIDIRRLNRNNVSGFRFPNGIIKKVSHSISHDSLSCYVHSVME